MNPTAWFLLADTIVTAFALVLAALAWWKVGSYCRQCRNVVQCYGPLVERAAERTAPQEPPLLCGEYRSAAFEGGAGKHAHTETLPAVGQLDDAHAVDCDGTCTSPGRVPCWVDSLNEPHPDGGTWYDAVYRWRPVSGGSR